MRKFIRRKTGGMLAVSLIFLPVLALPGHAEDQAAPQPPDLGKGLLFWPEDDATLEKQIAEYLDAAHGLKANFYHMGSDENDLVLAYQWSFDNAPDITVFIDAIIGRDKETSKVSYVTVKVYCRCKPVEDIKKGKKRNFVFECANNVFKKWVYPHRIFIDDNGVIVMQSFISIASPSMPTHAEQIYLAIVGMRVEWPQFCEMLTKKIKLTKAQ